MLWKAELGKDVLMGVSLDLSDKIASCLVQDVHQSNDAPG